MSASGSTPGASTPAAAKSRKLNKEALLSQFRQVTSPKAGNAPSSFDKRTVVESIRRSTPRARDGQAQPQSQGGLQQDSLPGSEASDEAGTPSTTNPTTPNVAGLGTGQATNTGARTDGGAGGGAVEGDLRPLIRQLQHDLVAKEDTIKALEKKIVSLRADLQQADVRLEETKRKHEQDVDKHMREFPELAAERNQRVQSMQDQTKEAETMLRANQVLKRQVDDLLASRRAQHDTEERNTALEIENKVLQKRIAREMGGEAGEQTSEEAGEGAGDVYKLIRPYFITSSASEHEGKQDVSLSSAGDEAATAAPPLPPLWTRGEIRPRIDLIRSAVERLSVFEDMYLRAFYDHEEFSASTTDGSTRAEAIPEDLVIVEQEARALQRALIQACGEALGLTLPWDFARVAQQNVNLRALLEGTERQAYQLEMDKQKLERRLSVTERSLDFETAAATVAALQAELSAQKITSSNEISELEVGKAKAERAFQDLEKRFAVLAEEMKESQREPGAPMSHIPVHGDRQGGAASSMMGMAQPQAPNISATTESGAAEAQLLRADLDRFFEKHDPELGGLLDHIHTSFPEGTLDGNDRIAKQVEIIAQEILHRQGGADVDEHTSLLLQSPSLTDLLSGFEMYYCDFNFFHRGQAL